VPEIVLATQRAQNLKELGGEKADVRWRTANELTIYLYEQSALALMAELLYL
jgi:hypothetical protein